ncbi:hypothetical protein [Halomonas sp. SCS19]|uniref:hypothetical protein n=1 Tax=Halomonas sp. SCS19 TaxID=2950870 RepID=UPI0032DFD4C0
MSRKFGTTSIARTDIFKSYSKFAKDHFNNSSRGYKFEENTYYNALSDACSFISSVTNENLSSVKSKKSAKAILEENHELIIMALKSEANRRTTGGWGKLRKTLDIAYRAAGLSRMSDQIKYSTNPLPPSDRPQHTKKSLRISKVSDKYLTEFIEALEEKKDQKALDLITLVSTFGMRPIEILTTKIVSHNDETITLHVQGAKKTLKGKELKSHSRGIDRTLTVESTPALLNALRNLQGMTINELESAQQRINRLSRKLKPTSEKHFCLYSLRYTFGSNLKKNLYRYEMGRVLAAAIMGHKNTSSISSYGHYRSGVLGADIPVVDDMTVKKVVDDVSKRFGRDRGENFDIGEAIRSRAYENEYDDSLSVNYY